MPNRNAASSEEIKKLKLEEVVLFAINNIPQADPTTLKQFLELANAGGTFGTISQAQVLKKMRQVLTYVPGACRYSLMVLVDLLEIEGADDLSRVQPSQPESAGTDPNGSETLRFFIDTSALVAKPL